MQHCQWSFILSIKGEAPPLLLPPLRSSPSPFPNRLTLTAEVAPSPLPSPPLWSFTPSLVRCKRLIESLAEESAAGKASPWWLQGPAGRRQAGRLSFQGKGLLAGRLAASQSGRSGHLVWGPSPGGEDLAQASGVSSPSPCWLGWPGLERGHEMCVQSTLDWQNRGAQGKATSASAGGFRRGRPRPSSS